LANSIGTIDNDYRGELCFVFYKVGKECKPYSVGDRIGQLIIQRQIDVEFERSVYLDETNRGTGGFGSSGK
jgi:dUTP pyrophosphatase